MAKVGWYEPKTYKCYCGLPQGSLNRLDQGIERLVSKIFEVDEDGDLPVQVVIVDRTNTGKLHYAPLLHTLSSGEAETRERFIENLRIAKLNVELAAIDLNSAIQGFFYFDKNQ